MLTKTEFAIIYFLYGLAFFSMGIALLPLFTRPSSFPLVRALPWLAGFGIVHGIHEWIEFLEITGALRTASLAFTVGGLATLTVSVFLLFQFGVELTFKLTKTGRWIRLVPLAALVIWLCIFFAFDFFDNLATAHLYGDVFARYLMYLPGSIVAGLALYFQYRLLASAGFKRLVFYLLGAALLFWLNAFFAGLVVPRAPFPPASFLNREAFLDVVGVPVVVFRALTALGVTFFVLMSMRIFDEEEMALRTKRERSLKGVDYLTSKVSREIDDEKCMPAILTDVFGLVSADKGAVFAVSPETDALTVETTRNLPIEPMKRFETPGEGTGRAIDRVARECSIVFGKLADNPEVLDATEGLTGEEPVALVPLVSKERCLGVLLLIGEAGDEFDAEEQAVLKAIGGQLGIALENRKLEEQRRIARILQQSLLTPRPLVHGLDIGVAYKPASAEMMVGGDFYDFIELPDERGAIVIGDVSGKGLGAAAMTSSAKNTIRAFLSENASPAVALSKANEVLIKFTPSGQFVTALAVVWSPGCSFSYASAGHPPPIICNEVSGTEMTGLPLGAFENVSYLEQKVAVRPGDCMALYTDGVTDARRNDAFFGEQGIRDSLRRGLEAGNAQAVADQVLADSVAFSGETFRDDMMLIVLKCLPSETAG
ncbi:MAG: GAF domain-containing SpoIIE family protein phosphatase [Candidatus Aquicultorales bacterium]